MRTPAYAAVTLQSSLYSLRNRTLVLTDWAKVKLFGRSVDVFQPGCIGLTVPLQRCLPRVNHGRPRLSKVSLVGRSRVQGLVRLGKLVIICPEATRIGLYMHGWWLVVGYSYTIDARKSPSCSGWARLEPCTLPFQADLFSHICICMAPNPVNTTDMAETNSVRLKSSFVFF